MLQGPFHRRVRAARLDPGGSPWPPVAPLSSRPRLRSPVFPKVSQAQPQTTQPCIRPSPQILWALPPHFSDTPGISQTPQARSSRKAPPPPPTSSPGPPAPTCGLRRREDLAKQARQSPWLSRASVSGSEDVAGRGGEQRRHKAVLECAVPGRGGQGDRRPRGRGGGRERGAHRAGGAGMGVTGAGQGEPGRRGRGLLGAGHAARLGGSQRGRGGPGAKGPSLLCRVARRLRWKCSAALRVK